MLIFLDIATLPGKLTTRTRTVTVPTTGMSAIPQALID